MNMQRARAKGMLWGLIVGDALGSPIQFSEKDGHKRITEMEPCPVFGMPAGCWTDDGSMSLCVMDSFVRKCGYDLEDIMKTFLKWRWEGYLSSGERAFDIGNATDMSLSMIACGCRRNGVEKSQGNGSIMRFAPGYLIARAMEEPVLIHDLSNLTHCSSRVRQVCDRFAAVLDEHMAGNRTTARSLYGTRAEVNNSGWAVSTLEAALWAFGSTDSFESALIEAVNLGGDSDTIGAVCGQIAGAYYGFNAIPERWVEAIKTSEEVDRRIENFLDTLEQVERRPGLKSVTFPESLDAQSTGDFKQLPTGSTCPHHGMIDGWHYVLKCGLYSTTSSDEHVRNEYIADEFLRAAGCRVPASRMYRADIGHGKVETVRLSLYLKDARHLREALDAATPEQRQRVIDQIVATYPVKSFIDDMDAYQHPELDNVMVDADYNLWFIDNGASFDFRAKGARKGWFWGRMDIHGKFGYFSLRDARRSIDPRMFDQHELKELLKGVSDEDLRRAAAKYNFSELVKTLPEDYRRPSLVAYAAALDAWSRE